uniref:Poly [ADP-ribose] polymerase n=1 Tax=Leptobrachium leishanense TaxID=445787 RepID=A0A8C5MGU8_9ANUR
MVYIEIRKVYFQFQREAAAARGGSYPRQTNATMGRKRWKPVEGVPIEAVELDPTEEEIALHELEIGHTPSANVTSQTDSTQAKEACQEPLTPTDRLSSDTYGVQSCLDPMMPNVMIPDFQTRKICLDPVMPNTMLLNQNSSFHTGATQLDCVLSNAMLLDPSVPCDNQTHVFLDWLGKAIPNAMLPGPKNNFQAQELPNRRVIWNGYHTRPEDDVDICSEFLSSQCHLGPACPEHHTVLPYVWQLRDSCRHIWHDVNAGAQETLERLYCDPKVVQVIGIHNGHVWMLDFSIMTVHDSDMYDKIRRLSTSTHAAAPFCTTYKYYFDADHDHWTEYSEDFAKSIEAGLREKLESVVCSSVLFTYKIDLLAMCQENLQTGKIRMMRKRPVFKSSIMIAYELGSCSPSVSGTNSAQYLNMPHGRVMYPLNWVFTDVSFKTDSESVPLNREDREFHLVYRCFHKTMSESTYVILEISRIQNYFQWEKYSRKRDYMRRQLANIYSNRMERQLFHGTDPTLVEVICRQNFDPRVSGRNGTVYGDGCYFARDAKLSHGYSREDQTKHYFMFLARVLVGRAAKGYGTFRRPPPINPDDPVSPLYNSCVSTVNNPDSFIIFDNDQCYPYFLIKYQKMQTMVLLD